MEPNFNRKGYTTRLGAKWHSGLEDGILCCGCHKRFSVTYRCQFVGRCGRHSAIDINVRGEKMYAVTEKDAQQNLGKLIQRVVTDVEPTIVIGDEGDRIVLVSLDEFNAWQETLYLLSSPANADRLQRSIAQMHEGRVQYRELIEP